MMGRFAAGIDAKRLYSQARESGAFSEKISVIITLHGYNLVFVDTIYKW